VVAGIINGVTKSDLRKEIKGCANNIVEIINGIIEGKDRFNRKDIKGGVSAVGGSLIMLPKTFMQCKGIRDTILDFMEWIKMFACPKCMVL
jgi:tartrate dehydratase alpha subunit/fumarate hydratase class I-like protein